MKTSLSLQVVRAALLGSALFLGACMTNDTAKEEYMDGTVDARTAGHSLAGSFSSAGDWNSTTAAPAAPLASLSASLGGTLKKSAALPKMSALGVDVKLDFDDTGKGIVTYYATTTGLFDTTSDTAVAKWDDKAKDDIKDNENVISLRHVVRHFGGKTESAVFVTAEGDADGIITPVPNTVNKVSVTFTGVVGGVTEQAVVVAGPGADYNWDKDSDNVVYSGHWTRTRNGTLIAEATFEDGDGDGIVTDNSQDCIVKAHFWEMSPKDKPFVKKADASITLKILANKAGNEPITFAYTEEMKSGRVNTVSLKNTKGGSDIIKNDTMWVKLETTVASDDDTLKHAEIVFVMNPGSDLTTDTDDMLYAIHVKTHKQHGFERDAEFNFVSDEAIPHGQQPVSGSFDGNVSYANGKSASLEGTFSPTKFSAKYTGPEGNSVTVEYTKNGEVVGGV
jgi:hypothetical protein